MQVPLPLTNNAILGSGTAQNGSNGVWEELLTQRIVVLAILTVLLTCCYATVASSPLISLLRGKDRPASRQAIVSLTGSAAGCGEKAKAGERRGKRTVLGIDAENKKRR